MKSKILLFLLISGLLSLQKSFGHCDTKNGPVVMAAIEALKTNNVNLVLIWVPEKDEEAIKETFKKTIELRKISAEVQEAMDNYFFETLVRIHRASEGMGYTGLKDDEAEVSIAAVDKALKTNSVSDVIKLLNDVINKGVHGRFNHAASKKNYDKNDVAAGREYVESYVMFMHYVETLYNTANSGASEHDDRGSIDYPSQLKDMRTGEISPVSFSIDNNNSSISDFIAYVLIISGILSVIIVQVILSRRKYAHH